MEPMDVCTPWDTQCAHCPAKCKGDRGCAIHFLRRHVFHYFNAINTCCPICQSDQDNGMVHIFTQHPTTCLYCLKNTFLGPHLNCFQIVKEAVQEVSGQMVFLPMFCNRPFL